MMPGTADCVPDYESFGKWATVVAAYGTDGKPLGLVANEENRFASCMSSEHARSRDGAEGYAGLEVRTGQRCV
jgi:hypothetical protein